MKMDALPWIWHVCTHHVRSKLKSWTFNPFLLGLVTERKHFSHHPFFSFHLQISFSFTLLKAIRLLLIFPYSNIALIFRYLFWQFASHMIQLVHSLWWKQDDSLVTVNRTCNLLTRKPKGASCLCSSATSSAIMQLHAHRKLSSQSHEQHSQCKHG